MRRLTILEPSFCSALLERRGSGSWRVMSSIDGISCTDQGAKCRAAVSIPCLAFHTVGFTNRNASPNVQYVMSHDCRLESMTGTDMKSLFGFYVIKKLVIQATHSLPVRVHSQIIGSNLSSGWLSSLGLVRAEPHLNHSEAYSDSSRVLVVNQSVF